MAIAPVASNTWLTAVTGGTATSVSKAFGVNVSQGSLLVAIATQIDAGNTDTTTFSDGVNTWVTLREQYSSSLGQTVTIGYAKNVAAGATTVQAAGTLNQKRGIAICEFTGADTSAPEDGTATGASSSGASIPSPGAIVTTGAGIVIGATVCDSTSQTAGASYTLQIDSVQANYYLSVQHRITTASVNESPAFGTSKSYWTAIGAAFKAAGGSASVAPIAAYYNSLRANS